MKACKHARNTQARKLLDAMNYLDDALIEEAAPCEDSALTDIVPSGFWKKQRSFRKITACAAILFIAAVSLWVWKSGIATPKRHVLDNGQSAGGADLCAPAECAQEFVLETDAVMEENGNAFSQNVQPPGDTAVTGMFTEGTVMEADTADAAIAEDLSGNLKEESKGNAIVRLIEEFSPKQKQDEEQDGSFYTEPCYKVPKKGSYFLLNGLKAAIDYWDNANNTIETAQPEQYLYHVTIDVFGDIEQNGETVYEELRLSDAGKELLYQEYERLFMEGFPVSLSEDFQLTGTLSREEIEQFEPFADYGYTFRLVNE